MRKDICTLRHANHATPLVNTPTPLEQVAAVPNRNAAVECARAADCLFILTASLSKVRNGPNDNAISFSTTPTPRRRLRAA